MGPRELKAQLGELDIWFIIFFKGIMENGRPIYTDPFAECDKTDAHPDEIGKNIPLTAGGVGATLEPLCEQEKSFGGGSQRTELMREDVERLCKKLSERYKLPEERHLDMFEIRNEELYYKGLDKPLTYEKERLRTVGEIEKILHKKGFVHWVLTYLWVK